MALVYGKRERVEGRNQGGGKGQSSSGQQEEITLDCEVARVASYCSSSSSSSSSEDLDGCSSFSAFLGRPRRLVPAGAEAAAAFLPRDTVELGLFLLPFGLPLGLFGVGDPLASCCGCFRGLPRPLFSAPSFSLVATVSLPESLIVSYWNTF